MVQFANVADADAYFNALDTSTWSSVNSDLTSKFNAWDSAENNKVDKDFDARKAAAALSGWFGSTMTTVSNHRTTLPTAV